MVDAVFPVIKQLFRVRFPELTRPPPSDPIELPPVIVIAESDAVTPASILNTWLLPPPLTLSAAVGPLIVCVPWVLLKSSGPEASVIVCAVAKTDESKVIV